MEEDGKRSRAGSAFARAREKLVAAGAGGAERLRRTSSRVADALGSAAGRIRETPAAEKLGAALETRRVIRRAAEARQRGNPSMAFRMLETELRERPDDSRLAIALWETALTWGRPETAVDVVLPVIRSLAASEAGEAARLWVEVATALPDARADAGVLVRLVPALLEGEVRWAVLALQHALDPEARGLTPGVAVRVAEYARVLDPPTALRAARIALDAPDLHESRREALRQLVDEIERGGEAVAAPPVAPPAPRSELAVHPPPPAPSLPGPVAPLPEPVATPSTPLPPESPSAPPESPAPESESPEPEPECLAPEPECLAPEPEPAIPEAECLAPEPEPPTPAPESPAPEPEEDELDDAFSALVIEPALEDLAPALRFSGVKVMAAVPTALGPEALELRVGEERRARIEYDKIEAIAVAEIVDSAGSGILIDLALNWHDEGDGLLRVVRLRPEEFDAGAVVGGVPENASGVHVLLTRLFERTEAVPRPDLDAALGDPIRVFDSIAEYEREVLQAGGGS